MTELKQKIRRLIETTGPMNIADYMVSCLLDPDHGYYTTREPFGRDGDFITAPEISQIFGELVGVWLYLAWKSCGSPDNAIIAEIGPGRGTLMKDILRALHQLDVKLASRIRVAMIEASGRLKQQQERVLAEAGFSANIEWYQQTEQLPEGPLFIVGNELFDALPMRQFVKIPQGWHERVIGVGKDEELAFFAGVTALAPQALNSDHEKAEHGAVVEIAPAREAVMDVIAERLARGGGAGLFIDYGYTGPAIGDTLQAIKQHQFDDVLAHPGEADITSHVDFTPLGLVAQKHGLKAQLIEQGEFLLELGLLERAGQLGHGKAEAEQEKIRIAVERLAAPEQMGQLFKVLGVMPKSVTVPPFDSFNPV